METRRGHGPAANCRLYACRVEQPTQFADMQRSLPPRMGHQCQHMTAEGIIGFYQHCSE